jgi:thiol-disulfide isomerase/thioredoxin
MPRYRHLSVARCLAAALCLATLVAGCGSGTSPQARSGVGSAGSSPVAGAPSVPASAAAAPAGPGAPTAKPAGAPTAAALPDRYDPNRNPKTDIQTALHLSAVDNREVLLDFGADWCPDCLVLQNLFKSAQVAPLLQQHYRVVAVDVGKFDHNLDFAKQYVDLRTSGIPALVVLAPNGSVRVATNDGAFANARTMKAPQVAAFLTRWAPAGTK